MITPRTVLFIGAALAVVGVVAIFQYFYSPFGSLEPTTFYTEDTAANTQEQSLSSPDESESETLGAGVAPMHVPEGWVAYTSSRWESGGYIAFSYPQGWNLEEQYDDRNGRLILIKIEGDDYKIQINQVGQGMGRPYDYTSKIGGYEARVWKIEGQGGGYRAIMGVLEVSFVININVPGGSYNSLDDLLSSVAFSR